MTAIDLLCDHWAETRNKRNSHTLKLKDGKELTIWWRPWTIDERDFVVEGFDPASESRMFRPSRFKRAFFIKAENESGERMFVATDMLMLGSRVDPAIIATVGGLMLADLNAANSVGAGDGEGASGPKA